MDNFICCLKFANGAFHRVNLSAEELDELSRADSLNKWRAKYTCRLPARNPIDATVLIWESRQSDRQYIYARAYPYFVRTIYRYTKHINSLQHMILFKKNTAGEYVSITNDEYIVHILGRLHSEDLRDWAESWNIDEFN